MKQCAQSAGSESFALCPISLPVQHIEWRLLTLACSASGLPWMWIVIDPPHLAIVAPSSSVSKQLLQLVNIWADAWTWDVLFYEDAFHVATMRFFNERACSDDALFHFLFLLLLLFLLLSFSPSPSPSPDVHVCAMYVQCMKYIYIYMYIYI